MCAIIWVSELWNWLNLAFQILERKSLTNWAGDMWYVIKQSNIYFHVIEAHRTYRYIWKMIVGFHFANRNHKSFVKHIIFDICQASQAELSWQQSWRMLKNLTPHSYNFFMLWKKSHSNSIFNSRLLYLRFEISISYY